MHHQVLIVGAGSAGLTVAARLRRMRSSLDVAVIDPPDTHYYQPLWTLVGGGDADREGTARPQASVIPDGVKWIQDAVKSFDPENKSLTTKGGQTYTYDVLVATPGLQLDWDKIPGLAGNVGSYGLCSNYSFETVETTWRAIQNFEGGNAIFTHPATPIKCGGAPQKIMYLAAEYWEKHKPKKPYTITFCIATPTIFGVPTYAKTLLEVCKRHNIDVRYERDLKSIDVEGQKATFDLVGKGGETETLDYAFMHVTPPMSAPDFVKSSPLAAETGWISVDKATAQHTKYPNVFSIGDASNLPTSKTGAAIRKQAPVAAQNVLDVLDGKQPSAKYDGYTSCPLVTGYGKLVLAEFDYDKNLQETFWFDQSKERKSMYLLKKHLLPKFYWDRMLKGRA